MSPEFHASLHQTAIDVFAAIGATVTVLALAVLIGVATGKINFLRIEFYDD